jgi:hypothetical protein
MPRIRCREYVLSVIAICSFDLLAHKKTNTSDSEFVQRHMQQMSKAKQSLLQPRVPRSPRTCRRWASLRPRQAAAPDEALPEWKETCRYRVGDQNRDEWVVWVASASASCMFIWRARGDSTISCRVEGCGLRSGGGDAALECPPPSSKATCAAAAACSGLWALAACEVDALAACEVDVLTVCEVEAAADSGGGGGGGREFCLLIQRSYIILPMT